MSVALDDLLGIRRAGQTPTARSLEEHAASRRSRVLQSSTSACRRCCFAPTTPPSRRCSSTSARGRAVRDSAEASRLDVDLTGQSQESASRRGYRRVRRTGSEVEHVHDRAADSLLPGENHESITNGDCFVLDARRLRGCLLHLEARHRLPGHASHSSAAGRAVEPRDWFDEPEVVCERNVGEVAVLALPCVVVERGGTDLRRRTAGVLGICGS